MDHADIQKEIRGFLFDEGRAIFKGTPAGTNKTFVYALDKPENAELKTAAIEQAHRAIRHIIDRDGNHPNINGGGDNIAANPKLRQTIISIAEVMTVYLYELQQIYKSTQSHRTPIGDDQIWFAEFAADRLSQEKFGGVENACHRLGISYPPPDIQPSRIIAEATKAGENLTKSIIGACVAAARESMGAPYPGWPAKGMILGDDPRRLGESICDP